MPKDPVVHNEIQPDYPEVPLELQTFAFTDDGNDEIRDGPDVDDGNGEEIEMPADPVSDEITHVNYMEMNSGELVEIVTRTRDHSTPSRSWESMLPIFTQPGFGTWVGEYPACPFFALMIGDFMRRAAPPVRPLPDEMPENWLMIRRSDWLSFPHGYLARLVLDKIVFDDAETLRAYTLYAPNLLVYKIRLQILYRLIGEVAYIARASERVLCIMFPILPFNKTKIITELVSAHGSQLRRCTSQERSESWATFDGTEELADNFRIDDAVDRAAAVTAYAFDIADEV